MTSVNDLEGFLRALEENPEWKEAVRAHILGEELLQLPVRFIAFAGRINAFIDQMNAFVSEQRQFNAEQSQFNDAFDRRLNRIEGDVGIFRAAFARNTLHKDAMGITMDLGLEYVRIVPQEELTQMTREAVGRIPTNELRSFRRADLVIEATDGSSTQYIAVEASYTADQRDTDRAQRNARFLTEFTGQTAHAVIASVRNDHHAEQQINSGAVYWQPLDDRGPAPIE